MADRELIDAINNLTREMQSGSSRRRSRPGARSTTTTDTGGEVLDVSYEVEQIKRNAKDIGDIFGNYASQIAGGSREFESIVDSSKSILKNTIDMTKQMNTFEKAAQGAGQAIAGLFSFFTGGIFGTVVKGISLLVGAITDLITGFDKFNTLSAKVVGSLRETDRRFASLQRRINLAGLGFASFEEGVLSMQKALPGMGREAERLADSLAVDATALDRLGFSFRSQAESISAATKVFGLSAKQAQQLNRNFLGLGQVFGMTGDDITQGFLSATKALGQFGKNVLKSFPKLQSVAKKTGASLDSMFGIINKFNTFEDAADMVGKLNAVLGGPFLDSIELLKEEDPSKIIETISGAFNDAGLDFEKSSRHVKHAISSIMGVSADEAARMLSDGGAAFQEAQITVEDAAKMTAQSTSALIAQSQNTISKMDRLIAAMLKVVQTLNDAMAPGGLALRIQEGLSGLTTSVAGLIISVGGLLVPLFKDYVGPAIMASMRYIASGFQYLIGISTDVIQFMRKEFMGETYDGSMTLKDIYGVITDPTLAEAAVMGTQAANAGAVGAAIGGGLTFGVGTVPGFLKGAAIGYGGSALVMAKGRAMARKNSLEATGTTTPYNAADPRGFVMPTPESGKTLEVFSAEASEKFTKDLAKFVTALQNMGLVVNLDGKQIAKSVVKQTNKTYFASP